MSDYLCGSSCHNTSARYIPGNNASGPDDNIVTNGYIIQNNGTASNKHVVTDCYPPRLMLHFCNPSMWLIITDIMSWFRIATSVAIFTLFPMKTSCGSLGNLWGSYQQFSPIAPNTPLFFKSFARNPPLPQSISRIRISLRRSVILQKCSLEWTLIFYSSSVSDFLQADISLYAQKK